MWKNRNRVQTLNVAYWKKYVATFWVGAQLK